MKPDLPACPEGIEIGLFDAADLAGVVGVLARGMRDNPLHVAALGRGLDRREEVLTSIFGDAATILGWTRHMLVARMPDEIIVGVCTMLPPCECQPTLQQQLRLLPGMLRLGPRSAGRVVRWFDAWAKRDLDERHWHLGPLAVDVHLHGMGIGSRLLQVACAQADAAGDSVYLETDKAINVVLYERFGFAIIGQEEVLGVPNWFMRRPAVTGE